MDAWSRAAKQRWRSRSVALISGSAHTPARCRSTDLRGTSVPGSCNSGHHACARDRRGSPPSSTAAPPSATGFYIAQVRIGGRKPARYTTGEVKVSHARFSDDVGDSSAVTPGSYRLRVCADDRGRIHEADERNNCRHVAPSPSRYRIEQRRDSPASGDRRCIPEPIRRPGAVEAPLFAQVVSARDDATPGIGIASTRLYQAAAPGGEDFSPTYTTAASATKLRHALLPDDSPYCFVVRAHDAAGNRDANSVERRGTNLCY